MSTDSVNSNGLVTSPSFREQAREFVRGLIVSGQMRPDSLYSAPQLAAMLQVSVTPVREALLDLAREGLLEPVRNRGFRVVSLTATELNDIYAIRLLLEVPGVAEAASRGGSKQEINELLDLARVVQGFAEKEDLIAYIQADRKFHIALIDLAGNRQLSDLVATLRDRVRLYGLSAAKSSKHMQQSSAEHFELVNLIKNRDANGAASLMRRHLERSRDVWSNATERTQPRPYIRDIREDGW